jgi:UDP-GlcNAc:undecaprenyl-phosphate/decaprenyl-phosphate GlcNAc-1-phosphate transferase
VKFITPLDGIVPILVAAFLLAAALSMILTPLVRSAAQRSGAVDRPNHRRVNAVPVPRGGGIAIVAAFLIVGLGAVVLASQNLLISAPIPARGGELVALFLGGAAAAAIGAIDDYLDLRARWQLVGQVVLALGAVALGINVGRISNPFGPDPIAFGGAFAVAFTVLWIVGMINSINFIDGLDGLSTGISLIAAVTLGTLSLTTQVGQPFVAILCLTLAGALLGFLRWNFHPASIFIGTSGVMFVGYTLALLAILGTAKVAVALLVLGVPIIDTFWIIVRRVLSGHSPFTPDRGHIHHRLLDVGLSHRQTVLLIYLICACLGGLSLFLSGAGQVYAFLGVVVGFGLILYVLTHGEEREALEADTYEESAGVSR